MNYDPKDAAKWYKYLSKALTTKNPKMRKFFHEKAIAYAQKVIVYKGKPDTVKKDRYGSLRDNMMDE